VTKRENSLDSIVAANIDARHLMINAERLYYTPSMKFAKAALSPEWQTATQLSAKWGTLDALVLRGVAESRVNPEMQTGVDAVQWRIKQRQEK
jgi:hypothetical protein